MFTSLDSLYTADREVLISLSVVQVSLNLRFIALTSVAQGLLSAAQ
jgi:hypothetical protein